MTMLPGGQAATRTSVGQESKEPTLSFSGFHGALTGAIPASIWAGTKLKKDRRKANIATSEASIRLIVAGFGGGRTFQTGPTLKFGT
jgi:hypothetical protein